MIKCLLNCCLNIEIYSELHDFRITVSELLTGFYCLLLIILSKLENFYLLYFIKLLYGFLIIFRFFLNSQYFINTFKYINKNFFYAIFLYCYWNLFFVTKPRTTCVYFYFSLFKLFIIKMLYNYIIIYIASR